MFTQQVLQDGSVILHPKKHSLSLIWMHGLGDTAKGGFLDVFKCGQFTKPDIKIILLQAPYRKVTCNYGAVCPSWFDIKTLEASLMDEKEISMEEVLESKKTITNCLKEECAKIGSKNVFIGGFSQGCAMALDIGLSYPEQLGGIIAMSGVLFPSTQLNPIQETTPLLITHGTLDQMLNCQVSQQSYKRMDNTKRKYCDIAYINNMGHEANMQVMDRMKQFFAKI